MDEMRVCSTAISAGDVRSLESCPAIAVTINQLPDECLQCVLSWLPLSARLLAAPRVCRRWRDALSGASPAWAHLDLDLDALSEEASRVQLDLALLLKRIAPLLPSVRRLRLLSLHGVPAEALLLGVAAGAGAALREVSSEVLLPLKAAAALAHCAHLEALDIYLDNRPGVGVAIAPAAAQLHWLRSLRRLRCLRLTFFQHTVGGSFPALACLTQLTSASFMMLHDAPRELADLPQLQQLSLQHLECGAFPDPVTRLTALTALSVSAWFDAQQRLPPGLPALSNLRSLALGVADPYYQRLAVPPVGLCGLSDLQRLTCLRLAGLGLCEWPREALATLSLLEVLDLQHNSICEVPPAASALCALRVLHLAYQLRPTGGDGTPAGPQYELSVHSAVTQLTSLAQLTVGQKPHFQGRFAVRLCPFPGVHAVMYVAQHGDGAADGSGMFGSGAEGGWCYELKGCMPGALGPVLGDFMGLYEYLAPRLQLITPPRPRRNAGVPHLGIAPHQFLLA